MADTRAGAAATDRHRREQVRLSAAAEAELRRAWQRLLDPMNIDATRGLWLATSLAIVRRYHRASQDRAAAYLARYRTAELGAASAARLGVLVTPDLDATLTANVLDATGPQALKKRIAQEVPRPLAFRKAGSIVTSQGRGLALDGGRSTIRETAKTDRQAKGWRRVTDGNPCTFCAMLCSRGPVYTAEALALTKDNGDPYHPHCGCSVEILYGPWEPTALEQRWIEQYEAAAKQAKEEAGAATAQDVLSRMRADGIFRDSPAWRELDASLH